MNALEGKRIIVTRSRAQAGALATALEEHGATVIECPAIEIHDPADRAPLERAAREAGSYDLLIFASANAVERFLACKPAAIVGKIGAVGPATANALTRAGLHVDFVPKRYVAEGLLESLADFPLRGCRVLLPKAAVARDVIPSELEKRGARVDVVEAYRTVGVAPTTPVDGADLVTFTSSSAVNGFVQVWPGVGAACIGPITAEAARAAGWNVVVEPGQHTIPGLVAAIVAWART